MNAPLDNQFCSEYLTRQLIAYIGNKRALLDFIRKAVKYTGVTVGKFLDLFSGSGSVSRLAKTLGFSVISNDWEYYSYVINKAFLEISPADLESLFASQGGLEAVLEELNSLSEPREPYLSLYYAPQSLSCDPDRERMFYSPENAKKIDAIREKIEEWYPEWVPQKYLLVALLLYEAATHTNTSGVFKAYHRGFGGLGKDALQRILTPVNLEKPCLWFSNQKCEVYRRDATKLVRELDWKDIAITYLDPPYNQHQYGSNYHLLNTIALWDKPPLSNDFKIHGKAGIRKDWSQTRSPYCYRDSATETFMELTKAIQSPWTILSYNTEGIIPFGDLLKILKDLGKVSLFTNKYVKYRGGRQSIHRRVNNLEFLIILEKGEKHLPQDDKKIEKALLEKKLDVFQEAVLERKILQEKGWEAVPEGFQKGRNRIFAENQTVYKGYSGSPEKIFQTLNKARVLSKDEEIRRLFLADPHRYRGRIFNAFKKIAHRKYRREFLEIYELLRDRYSSEKRFLEILEIARKRKVLENET